jgi:hypothetical protein
MLICNARLCCYKNYSMRVFVCFALCAEKTQVFCFSKLRLPSLIKILMNSSAIQNKPLSPLYHPRRLSGQKKRWRLQTKNNTLTDLQTCKTTMNAVARMERYAALPPLLLAIAMRTCMTADDAVHVYRRLCPQRRFNKAVVHALAERNGLFALECAPPHLLDSFSVVIAAVKNNGLALQHASDRLKDNPLIVLRAAKQCGLSLKFAAARFRANKKLVLDALRNNTLLPTHGKTNRRSHTQVSSSSSSSSSSSRLLFELVAPELQNDIDVVLAAVASDGHCLKHASPKMRACRQVAAAAVAQAPLALRHASSSLQSDRDFVIDVVSKNGLALAFASPLCCADAGVVLVALANNGFALQYASDALKRQTHVVLAAVRQNGNALQFAAEECKNNMDVVLVAVTTNFEAVRFASAEMQQESQVKLRACAQRHSQASNTCGRTVMLLSSSENV